MKSYSCPSCGAAIPFRSNVSVYAVCPYCRSMVVRRDVDVESIGTMAALPDDMSPFQVGTEGVYKSVHFGIIGRMKIGWDDGNWNEWFIVSDDQRKGWLAEAQGFYAVSFERNDPVSAETENALKKIGTLDLELDLWGQRFKVVDVKQATCIGSEGELPFRAPQGRKTLSVDLEGEKEAFASVEVEGDTRRIYVGSYVDWADLKCSNFRKYEGW
jgi:hypothetical protein